MLEVIAVDYLKVIINDFTRLDLNVQLNKTLYELFKEFIICNFKVVFINA